MDNYTMIPLADNVDEMFIGPFGSSLKNDCFVEKENGYCMVYEQKHAIQKTMDVETRYVSEEKYNELKRFNVRGGDIIVSCRGTIGETFVVPDDAPLGIMHPSIMKIRLKEDVYDKSYFNLLLREHLKKHDTTANGSGVKMAISAKELGSELFPVPPMDEQRKISKTISEISEIIAARQQQLQKLDELVKARFVELFGDMILNPNSWEKVDLGTVCDVRDGTHDSPKYFAEGIPLVTSRNLSSGRIDFTDCNLICEADYNKINERSKVDLGDILMPMIGTVGNPIIVDIDAEFAIKNVALIKFSENSKVVNVFVKALLESDYFDRAVLDKVRGGTQKFISLGDIRRLKVCLPPLEVQKQFAAFVTQTDKSKAAVQKALDEAQLLFDSLMQKYFG